MNSSVAVSTTGTPSRFSASRYLAARGSIGAAVVGEEVTGGADTTTVRGGALATVGAVGGRH
jgi:hypothetical protein